MFTFEVTHPRLNLLSKSFKSSFFRQRRERGLARHSSLSVPSSPKKEVSMKPLNLERKAGSSVRTLYTWTTHNRTWWYKDIPSRFNKIIHRRHILFFLFLRTRHILFSLVYNRNLFWFERWWWMKMLCEFEPLNNRSRTRRIERVCRLRWIRLCGEIPKKVLCPRGDACLLNK